MKDASDAWYLLRDALFHEDFEFAETHLQAHPGLLEERDGVGETVLHFLAIEDCLAGVAWLHARGASLDTRDDLGTPVVFDVAGLGYADLLQWFVAQGADLQQRDWDGRDLVAYVIARDASDMAAARASTLH